MKYIVEIGGLIYIVYITLLCFISKTQKKHFFLQIFTPGILKTEIVFQFFSVILIVRKPMYCYLFIRNIIVRKSMYCYLFIRNSKYRQQKCILCYKFKLRGRKLGYPIFKH